MNAFIEKHQKNIIGVLSGRDRIVFRGTLRLVAKLAGMNAYLWHLGILMKDFKQYALDKTAQLIQASCARVDLACGSDGHIEKTRKISVSASRTAFRNVARNGQSRPTQLAGQPIHFFGRKGPRHFVDLTRQVVCLLPDLDVAEVLHG